MRAGVFLALAFVSIGASAQLPRRLGVPPRPAAPAASSAPSSGLSPESSGHATNFRGHFGADLVSWELLRSPILEERLRALDRLNAIGTPEAVAFLVRATDSRPGEMIDPRELLVQARALAKFSDQEKVRLALVSIMNAEAMRERNVSLESGSDALYELTRDTAALALAKSRTGRAYELLFAQMKEGSPSRNAARNAVIALPPPGLAFLGDGKALEGLGVRALGQLSDLRSVRFLRPLLSSTAADLRANAAKSLGQLGDEPSLVAIRALSVDPDPLVRAAATDALVSLAAPDRVQAVTRLFDDERTVRDGVALSPKAFDDHVVELLHARAVVNIAPRVRLDAIDALGKIASPSAVRALFELAQDPTIAFESVFALARNPDPGALASLALLVNSPGQRTLAIRGYVARVLRSGERQKDIDRTVLAMKTASRASERALAAFARVALGDDPIDVFLSDPAPSVQHAAAMGLLSLPVAARMAGFRPLTRAANVRRDPILTALAANGLVTEEVPLAFAMNRAMSGAVDAPLYARVVGERVKDTDDVRIGRLLGSASPLVRLGVVRGIGARTDDAHTAGILRDAYRFETDARVRFQLVRALVRLSASPARRETLDLAAALDPDPKVRAFGRSNAAVRAAAFEHEATWMRLVSGEGETPSPFLAQIVRPDGETTVILFDNEGHAILGAVPSGESELLLAPQPPTYESGVP